ncbi:MAG: hypothetical protein II969_18105 [Anaerolineaceae bacterium]|nr:hypothetical protein [Anaerolineaceae bacterium]
MKKILFFVVLTALMTISSIFAQDTGIQLISGPKTPADKASMDNLKLGKDVKIYGWGILQPTSFEFIDNFRAYDMWSKYGGPSSYDSDYAFLKMDITNTALTGKNYLEDYNVECIFDYNYIYGGFARQYDLNKSKDAVFGKDESFTIMPMYQGHYAFGCALPNAVINSEKPLRLEINIDGNILTYHIRK